MGLFDRLFKPKKSDTENQNQTKPQARPSAEEAKPDAPVNKPIVHEKPKTTPEKKTQFTFEQPKPVKTPLNLKQYVLEQYKLNGLNFESINTEYVAPCCEELLKNDYQKRQFEHDPEAFKEKYLTLFSIAYLVYHFPKDEIIISLLKYFFSDGKSHYEAREMFRSNGGNGLHEFPEKQTIINTGVNVLRIYHALYLKTDQNFSYTQQVPSMMNNVRNSENGFNILLDVATRQTTNDTPWVLINVLIHKTLDYKTKIATTHADKKELVLKKLGPVLNDFNQENKLSLSIDDIVLLGEHIAKVELSESYLKTDYKNQKKLGLKDWPELAPFIELAKNNMPTFIDAWMYFGSFYFTSNLVNLFKQITVNLLSSQTLSNTDFTRWLSIDAEVRKEHNRSFMTPCFEAYVASKAFSDFATNKFEAYFYKYYGISESKSIPKKIADSLSSIANENPNTLEREFKKLIYKSPVSVSHLTSASYGLYTGSKNTREEGVLAIHSQFNAYVPSSVKSVNKGQYYQEDKELFVLNIDGEDHNIPNALTLPLNKILAERKTGVRFVPIPIDYSKGYRDTIRYITVLSLMNLSQFRYLTEQYIPSKFPELKNAQAFESIQFINHEGEALHEIKEDDIYINKDQVFSGGFANDVKWAWFKEAYTDKLKSKEKWNKAMDVLTTFTGTKKPASKWVTDMNKVIDEIGEAQYYDELGSLIYESREEKSWFFDEYNKTLKGMIWSCTLRSTERSLLIIKTVTELSYTKVPSVGPRSTKTGNFCMEALANSPSEIAYGILQLMRMKSKYPRFVKAIDKFIDKYKENNKGNIEELEDKALPDFGFKNGVKIYDFIDAKLEVSFNRGKIVKTYVVNDKSQKKIPDSLNQQHSARLKEVTAEIKQINEIFKSLHERLKTFWMYNRSWKYSDWNKYIFNHPLMNPLIENMVWIGVDSDELFISKTDQLIQTSGATIELDENEEVALWHPIMASTEETEELKKYFLKNKLNQIEKQVEREHYRFTKKELEEDQSDRFANQNVEVRKLMALANSAGWTFTYVHEDVSWPRIYLKELDITAHFKCEYDRTADAIPTGEFFFSRGNSMKISYNTAFDKLKLAEIQATTLSEICRAIDMFISVAAEKK